jgi:transcription antitermination factor NusG
MIPPSPDAWFVLQVAPRSERRVASMLEYKGYEPLAPTYQVRRRWSDRVKTVEEPLFPGYVFVRTQGVPSGLMCSTAGVVRLLSFGGRPCPVPTAEIEAIRSLTRAGVPEPIPYCTLGQKVTIKDGPFAGIVGIVKQIRGRTSLVVSVQLIEQSIGIDVSEFQVEPAAAGN